MTEAQWLACDHPERMLQFLWTGGTLSGWKARLFSWWPRPRIDWPHSGVLTQRKARLFGCACVRRIWHLLTDPRSRSAVVLVEQDADGLVGEAELAVVAAEAERAASDLPLERRLAVIRAEQGFGAEYHRTAREATAVEQAQSSAAWAVVFLAGWNGVGMPKGYDAAPHEVTAQMSEWAALQEGGERTRQQEVRGQCDLLRDLFGPLPFRPVTIEPFLLTWQGGTIVQLAKAIYEERQMPDGTLDKVRLALLADALEDGGSDNQEMLSHLRQQEAIHVRGCWCLDLLLGKRDVLMWRSQ